MKESLSISQNQQLVQRLSPRQVLFVRMLEMNSAEIDEEVRRQLDDNPALEVADNADAASDDEPEAKAEASIDDNIDYEDDPADYAPASRGDDYTRDAASWQIADDAPDLMEHLAVQLRQLELSERQYRLAYYIAGNLDANGYLTRTLSAIADDLAITLGLEVEDQELREAFALVRTLDPAGIGAVDLRDCLLLQLDRKKPITLPIKVAREIVADNFDLFSKLHYDRLLVALGLDDEELLREAIDVIKSLNPKPGSGLEPAGSTMRWGQITPDIVVEEDDNGRFTVSMANAIPALQVERSFLVDIPMASQNKSAAEAMAFIKLKREDAETFISALKQRSNTMLAVAESIVRRQKEFFATGDTSVLRPMILKDVSQDTGLDLSAISRATAGKYIASPIGVYPMKLFFNEAPIEDSETSSHQVLHQLKEIIDAEDKSKPLSDQALMDALKAKGMNIARRTITKYREKLGMPVARLRKTL